MAIHKPSWFSETHVMVSTAPTCGLTKGGEHCPSSTRSQAPAFAWRTQRQAN